MREKCGKFMLGGQEVPAGTKFYTLVFEKSGELVRLGGRAAFADDLTTAIGYGIGYREKMARDFPDKPVENIQINMAVVAADGSVVIGDKVGLLANPEDKDRILADKSAILMPPELLQVVLEKASSEAAERLEKNGIATPEDGDTCEHHHEEPPADLHALRARRHGGSNN